MDKTVFYWNGFEPLWRILVVGTLAYIAIVLILRVSGKRTLASMNAFDFIITVTIGSAFGRILTAKGTSISEAVTAFLLLAALQYIFSVLEVKWKAMRKIITSPPALLYYNGNFLKKPMNKQRIRVKDLEGAVRKKGFSSMEEVEAVILESDGSFSVLKKSASHGGGTYKELLEEK